MQHLLHIRKGKEVPEFTQKEIDSYKSTFNEVHLSTQKVEGICKEICKHHGESNSF